MHCGIITTHSHLFIIIITTKLEISIKKKEKLILILEIIIFCLNFLKHFNAKRLSLTYVSLFNLYFLYKL